MKKGGDTLKKIVDDLQKLDVEWWALSIRAKDGSRMTVHSKGAPNRPQGITQ